MIAIRYILGLTQMVIDSLLGDNQEARENRTALTWAVVGLMIVIGVACFLVANVETENEWFNRVVEEGERQKLRKEMEEEVIFPTTHDFSTTPSGHD